jgi:hypothetical protein
MNTRIRLGLCGIIAALAVAGCSSGGGAGLIAKLRPPWAKALGPGVTVTGPGGASAGDGSPGGVMLSTVADVRSGDYGRICALMEPSAQGECDSSVTAASTSALAGRVPTFSNFAVSYTAIDGDQALVGTTGTVCVPNQTPACYTNTDPAALLDSGKSFAALWTEAIGASGNAYSLAPSVKVNGTWYAYTTP